MVKGRFGISFDLSWSTEGKWKFKQFLLKQVV